MLPGLRQALNNKTMQLKIKFTSKFFRDGGKGSLASILSPFVNPVKQEKLLMQGAEDWNKKQQFGVKKN